MLLWNKFGQVEIYNGLRSKMKLSKGCSFSSKENRGREREREGMEWEGREGEGKGGQGTITLNVSSCLLAPKTFKCFYCILYFSSDLPIIK